MRKLFRKKMINTIDFENIINSMHEFINETIANFSDVEDYIVVIDKDNNGILYYDKDSKVLYYDYHTIDRSIDSFFPDYTLKFKKSAFKKSFNETYPDLHVRRVSGARLTTF
jgi:ribosomal protein S24E